MRWLLGIGTVVVLFGPLLSTFISSPRRHNGGHRRLLLALSVEAGGAVAFVVGMSAMLVIADHIARRGRIPTGWTNGPTLKQWAVGVPAILATAALVAGVLLLTT